MLNDSDPGYIILKQSSFDPSSKNGQWRVAFFCCAVLADVTIFYSIFSDHSDLDIIINNRIFDNIMDTTINDLMLDNVNDLISNNVMDTTINDLISEEIKPGCSKTQKTYEHNVIKSVGLMPVTDVKWVKPRVSRPRLRKGTLIGKCRSASAEKRIEVLNSIQNSKRKLPPPGTTTCNYNLKCDP